MPHNSQYTHFYIDQFVFSGDSNGLDLAVTVDKLDATCFQDSGKVYVQSKPDAVLSQQGLFSAGTDSLEEEIYTRLGTGTSIVAAMFGTDTTACAAYVLPDTAANQYNVSAAVGSLIAVETEWSNGATQLQRGKRTYSGTASATGAQTSIDLGSAGSSGGTAYLFVTGVTGTATGASIKLQSSANDSTFDDEATFTVNGLGAQSATLSGTVNRYLRANVVGLGGATNITFTLIACVNGVTM